MKPQPPWCRCAPARSGAEAAPEGCCTEAGAEAGLEVAAAAAACTPSKVSSAVASRRQGGGVPLLASRRRGGEAEEAEAPPPRCAGEAETGATGPLGEG